MKHMAPCIPVIGICRPLKNSHNQVLLQHHFCLTGVLKRNGQDQIGLDQIHATNRVNLHVELPQPTTITYKHKEHTTHECKRELTIEGQK